MDGGDPPKRKGESSQQGARKKKARASGAGSDAAGAVVLPGAADAHQGEGDPMLQDLPQGDVNPRGAEATAPVIPGDAAAHQGGPMPQELQPVVPNPGGLGPCVLNMQAELSDSDEPDADADFDSDAAMPPADAAAHQGEGEGDPMPQDPQQGDVNPVAGGLEPCVLNMQADLSDLEEHDVDADTAGAVMPPGTGAAQKTGPTPKTGDEQLLGAQLAAMNKAALQAAAPNPPLPRTRNLVAKLDRPIPAAATAQAMAPASSSQAVLTFGSLHLRPTGPQALPRSMLCPSCGARQGITMPQPVPHLCLCEECLNNRSHAVCPVCSVRGGAGGT